MVIGIIRLIISSARSPINFCQRSSTPSQMRYAQVNIYYKINVLIYGDLGHSIFIAYHSGNRGRGKGARRLGGVDHQPEIEGPGEETSVYLEESRSVERSYRH